ncbi:hypothetical protein GCM10023205_52690 [Yinghuangia aomiensis]|uniref:PPM-type phosphatase domain-containing protein n=1 Tax=Yinghuangia aomiensis TaxID=676205 RepID=A0ABP9HTZ8_9ACTN
MLLMGQLRAGLRAFASMGMEPHQVLERVNLLLLDLSELWMAMCSYGIFDPRTRSFKFATAGHQPPMLRGPRAMLDVHPDIGPPLGAVADVRYRSHVVQLPKVFVGVMYTDGLIETPGLDMSDGFARLRNVLENSPPNPERVIEHVINHPWLGGTHEDDLVALCFGSTLGP